jgi:predicted RNA-binding Zn-ribbon protein involved in translation (DUF1610 family)
MKKHISLKVSCPYCMQSLMDEETKLHGFPSIKLNIKTENDRGTIRLCSVYECFDHQSDIPIAKGEIVEFSCPHCNKELLVKEECHLCDAPMVSLSLATGGRVNICSRKGCSNHYVAFQDLSTELSNFYQYFGE